MASNIFYYDHDPTTWKLSSVPKKMEQNKTENKTKTDISAVSGGGSNLGGEDLHGDYTH